MATIDQYWEKFEDIGFIKTKTLGKIEYSIRPHLGTGGFSVLGDSKTVMGLHSDVTLNKPIVIREGIKERHFEFGHYYMGESSFYQKKSDKVILPHGLYVQTNYKPYYGYKRVESGVRLVSVGMCYREDFFKKMGNKIPEDFWKESPKIFNQGPIRIPKITHICCQIRDCQLNGDSLIMYMEGKGLEAMALLIEYFNEEKKKSGEKNRKRASVFLTQSDLFILKQIREQLEERIKNPPTIGELTKMYPINQQKLVDGFKQTYNSTIHSFSRHMKMTKAVDLLRTTDFTIARIAQEVGYYGDGHFQKVFKSTYGIAPSQMRNELKILDIHSHQTG